MNRIPFALSFIAAATLSLGCVQPAEQDDAPTPQSYAVSLQVASPAGLPRCGGSLAGTTAFVAAPAGLWSCQGSAWIPVPCTPLLAGAVAYASATQTLWACTAGQWAQVSLPAGPQGEPGTNGVDGSNGLTSLIVQSPEPPGTNCVSGGTKLQSGTDTNDDGGLSEGEITAVSYVCNGAEASGDARDPFALNGTPCTLNGETGSYLVTYPSGQTVPGSGFASVQIFCELPPVDERNCFGLDVTALPHAMGSCVNRRPLLGSCEPGWADMDGVIATGCERKNAVPNGGFEDDNFFSGGTWRVFNAGSNTAAVHSGARSISMAGWIFQSVTIPEDATVLRFWATGSGTASLRPQTGDAVSWQVEQDLLAPFQEVVLDISALRGQRADLSFSASYQSWLWVDDVVIE